ncbi:MAG: hypothetical protein N4A49_06205 [Marinifilaceae bacterium]|jgi:hypothetical protein|nr:hypothetical protein [Marinifilaceae bacterium]
MKVLEELAKHNWDFVLYKTDHGFVINVVFYQSAFDYSRSFKISELEAKQNMDKLKELSEHIRNNYDLYKSREIVPVVRRL